MELTPRVTRMVSALLALVVSPTLCRYAGGIQDSVNVVCQNGAVNAIKNDQMIFTKNITLGDSRLRKLNNTVLAPI